jgi:F-type H+-transporting ATPase subunit delta
MKTTKRSRRSARRLYRACIVDGLLDEGRARQVARRVAEARRRGSLPLLSHFRRLVKLDRDRHKALVESATPLSAELRASVESGVTRVYGPGVTTAFADDPALIGGMRVKVGSDVYDGSVRTALLALEERF